MGKRDKKQAPATGQDEGPKGYQPRFFKSVEWLGFDSAKGGHQVRYEGNVFPASTLMTLVDVKALYCLNHVVMFQTGYNVKYSEEKFFENCNYELTDVFAKVWLDTLTQSISDAMYYMVYNQEMANHHNSKEAYKVCDNLEKEFLTLAK